MLQKYINSKQKTPLDSKTIALVFEKYQEIFLVNNMKKITRLNECQYDFSINL